MDDTRIGIIGAGVHMKANIAPSLFRLGRTITAVATEHPETAEAAAHQLHAQKHFGDYRKMLEAPTEVVFVATRGEDHARIVSDCLAAGKHVFVDKPLGLTEPQATRIAEEAGKAKRKVAVGFMKRYAPAYKRLKELTSNSRELGKAWSFRAMFAITSGREGWVDEKYLKFGAIHYVDLLRHYFGEPIDILGLCNSEGVKVDQTYALRFDSGVVGSLFLAGLPAWKRHYEEITITFEGGLAQVDNISKFIMHRDAQSRPGVTRWQEIDECDEVYTSVGTSSSGGWKELYLNGYVGEVQAFLSAVEENTEVSNSATDNVRTMKMCDSMLEALRAR